jgi:hypothetical protein
LNNYLEHANQGGMRKIFVAIPAHSGTWTVPTGLSLIHAQAEALRNGWDFQVYNRSGDADLAQARNVLAAKFLSTDCTDLLMVDSDVSWHEGEFLRIMTHEVDFVAGAYRQRTDEVEHYPILWPDKKQMWVDPKTNLPLLDVEGVPLGFVRVTRNCMERMAAAKAETYFYDPTIPGIEVHWIFDFTWDGNVRRSEDFAFCRLWKSLGGTIWLDPALGIDHTGIKTFEGDLMGHLARATKQHDSNGNLIDTAKRLIAQA